MRISIASSFYNSKKRLKNYFKAIKQLKLDGIEVQYVFVDNASSDSTYEDLVSFSQKLHGIATVLKEGTPGLMHARCAAVQAATFEYVLFLDDDNEISADYLLELRRIAKIHPDASFITGNCVPPKEYNIPGEIIEIADVVAIRERKGEFAFELLGVHSPYGPWGAGLFGNREEIALACKYWLSTDKKINGRTGNCLSGGEDHWIIQYVCSRNRKIVFSDALTIIHRIEPHRLKVGHLCRVAYQLGFDWVDHLNAFEAVRPGLKQNIGGDLSLLILFVAKIPRNIVIFFILRELPCLMKIGFQLGLGLNMIIASAERAKQD
jgi:glycosyltransferase involved in cell wall biosynthesis